MQIPLTYINLESDAIRRLQIESELRRLGLDAIRFDAVRWDELPSKEKKYYYSDSLNASSFHIPLIPGEKGCYISHLRAWEMLLSSDSQALVVLEDDARLSDDFPQIVERIESFRFEWDMIKLIGRETEKVRKVWQLGAGFSLVDYARIPSLTAGYVISRSGARKLINSRIPFGRPIDVDLRHWWENDLLVFGVAPSVIMLNETSLTSSIGRRNDFRGIRVRAKKFFLKFKMTVMNALHSYRKRRPEIEISLP